MVSLFVAVGVLLSAVYFVDRLYGGVVIIFVIRLVAMSAYGNQMERETSGQSLSSRGGSGKGTRR